MKLVKVTCEIRYAGRMKLLASYEKLHADLLGKEPEKPEQWISPGLRLDDRERKRVMVVDAQRSIIDVEQPPNVGFCRDSIAQFFRRVDEAFQIPEVARWGLQSTWVDEYECPISDLLARCKERIFRSSALAEEASDVGAIFDHFPQDGIKLTITMGPMQLEQLKGEFLTFEPQGLAEVFLYVSVDMGDTKTRQYSARHLADFLRTALQTGERMATQAGSQVKGETA